MITTIINQIETTATTTNVSFMTVKELPFVSSIAHIGNTPATVKTDLKKTIKMLKDVQVIVNKIGESVVNVDIAFSKFRNKKCINIVIRLNDGYTVTLCSGVMTYFSVIKEAKLVEDFLFLDWKLDDKFKEYIKTIKK